ncbi:PREDICTED: toll-interacting protein B [Amphimedon queenslandica]|eukprot:XP_003385164.1 PREDICTED: toll-interacting protein B [Amphimedon queenslandica]
MATIEDGQEQSKRDRAFLGQLPDDFLRVEEVPRSEQRTSSHQRDHPHLVPMTYSPQQLGYRHGDGSHVGKLKVTILQAKLAKNYGLTRMDPYCRVRIGHAVYETPTDINGSKNPRWNKTFSVNLPRGVTSVYVEIFNERYLSLDDRIAWGYYELPTDVFNGETVEEWIPLTGKQGDEKEGNINFIFSLSPLHQLVSSGGVPYQQQPAQYPPGFMPQQPQTQFQGSPVGYYPPTPLMMQPQQQPTAVQAPSRPPVTDEDVRQMKEMFPTVDNEVVKSVLEATGGNKDQAVTNLLSMTTE